jgi:hypothetical protein
VGDRSDASCRAVLLAVGGEPAVPRRSTTTTMTDDDTDDGTAVLHSCAYVAVGLLASAVGDGPYYEADIDEAWEHLHEGLRAADSNTEGADRVERALSTLADLNDCAPDERDFVIRDALAELAPVAAGLTGTPERGRTPRTRKPTVPVFYNIPRMAADRAIRRFQQRLEREDALGPAHFVDFLYEEVSEEPVIYVDGETLAEYASGRIDRLTTEGWTGSDPLEGVDDDV